MRDAIIGLVVLVVVNGCTTIPMGPNVGAFVGYGKTLQQYQYDDAYCRQYAAQQLGTTEAHSTTHSTATTAAITGVLGAGLGAAIGAVTGSPGAGAAIGGATGLATGAALGVNRGDRAAMTLQQRYDQGWLLCMDAYGHRVAGAQPPSYLPPPPPPGIGHR